MTTITRFSQQILQLSRLCLCSLFFSSIGANAALVQLESNLSPISVGQDFWLTLNVQDRDSSIISALDLRLFFDSQLARLNTVEFGQFLGGASDSLQDSSIELNQVSVTELSLLGNDTLALLQDIQNPSMDLSLMRFNFTAIEQGQFSISKDYIDLFDGNFIPQDTEMLALSLSILPNSQHVTAPHYMGLFISLIVIGLTARRSQV
ncbi:hypothetical protein [Aliiglaciecola sp. LCG003]|uniref:hypothetical protein n=1 Tax=Aliiglaciecola sp. LCG003 TaxID=3053655 RepID=UPI0025745880|nr:hypothetical protein [Aliiglaciecola sp. LCG003]WJG09962.1 hypothetical protein QR722_02695 [Aliiglaciecola sp. LCG003]